jgi:hypothetical protein
MIREPLTIRRRATAAVLPVVGVAVLLFAACASSEPGAPAASSTAEPSSPAALRTPWGDPDLQGIWTDPYQTPLQRPAAFADKEFFTDQERARFDELRANVPRADARLAPRGSEQDVSGAYPSVFNSLRPTGPRTSLIVDPPDGRRPANTKEAQRRRQIAEEYRLALLQATEVCRQKLSVCDGGTYGPPSPRRNEVPPYYVAAAAEGGGAINRSDGPEDRSLSERCLGGSLPDFGGFRRIVQSPGAVSIFYDTGQGQGWQRIVPITGNPHLPPHVRQWWGDSRGRWEGDTLVVDVTNFSPKTDFQGSTDNLHLVERWRRASADTIEYTLTMEDETTWVRPWTVKQEFARQDERANRFYPEPRCHEGNDGMAGMLIGARAEERAFARGRGPHPATRCTAGCGTGTLPAMGGQDIDALSRKVAGEQP